MDFTVGYQRWDDILFLHWPVPLDVVQAHVDPRLEIDTFDGQPWVSLTPFTMKNARLRFMPPLPGISRFHELNFRTYVRRDGVAGIWFFSLDAASPLAVAGARAAFGLPYFNARMKRWRVGEDRHCTSERLGPDQASVRVAWRPRGELPAHPVGSLEHFLVERYSLYSRLPIGALARVDVRHPAWALREVVVLDFEESVSARHGLPGPTGVPLAHASAGVDVRVLHPRVPVLTASGRAGPRAATIA